MQLCGGFTIFFVLLLLLLLLLLYNFNLVC